MITLVFNPAHRPGTPPDRIATRADLKTVRREKRREASTADRVSVRNLRAFVAAFPDREWIIGSVINDLMRQAGLTPHPGLTAPDPRLIRDGD